LSFERVESRQINIDLAEGKAPFDAVIDSAVSRARPVSMAAVTTVLGIVQRIGGA
jgi:multidrug efflux pump subunit AcrB